MQRQSPGASFMEGMLDVTINNRANHFTHKGKKNNPANTSDKEKDFGQSKLLSTCTTGNWIFISEALCETEPKNDKNCTSQY